MNEKQKAALDRINKHLAEIKSEINENWGPDARIDTEVALFIQDRMFSIGRKRKEDIEGDVHDLEMSSR